jgi:hypothetical protein
MVKADPSWSVFLSELELGVGIDIKWSEDSLFDLVHSLKKE